MNTLSERWDRFVTADTWWPATPQRP